MSDPVAPLRHEGSPRQVMVAGAVAGLVSRYVVDSLASTASYLLPPTPTDSH
jgi:hypothetical protein